MVSNARRERAILEKIVRQAQKEFSKKSREIKYRISPVVYNAIYNSPEMSSVRSGSLRFAFGLVSDPTTMIANAIADSCKVSANDIKLSGNKIVGGITVNIQPQDYLNVLQIPQAFNVIEDGSKLPWLEWLTLYGSQIIIIDFGVKYGSGLGRTGGAIMTTGARPFRVDPTFAGDKDNNFITRAIEKAVPEISKKIQEVL